MKIISILISLIWLIVSTTESDVPPMSSIITPDKSQRNDYEEICNNESVHLNLSNTALPSIGSDFITSSIVTCLILRNNGNRYMSSSAFDKLPNLAFLDLSYNDWGNQQFLQQGSYPHLKSLVMNKVIIHTYSPTAMIINGKFPMLKKLYLIDNDFYYLSGGFEADISKLTHLYLSNNNIQLISPLDQNGTLIPYKNDFSWFPKSLKHLDLDNNQLNSISFTNMSNLKLLSARNNKLEMIQLKKLNELKYLFLDGNNLQSITMNIQFDTPKLQYLNLTNNKIAIFDGRFVDYLPLLENLDLSSNLLKSVPEIQHALNLRNFSLKCNNIKLLKTGNFNLMPKLQFLTLDNNEIAEIESEVFSQMENVEVLSLGRNKITHLPKGWMKNLQKLHSLYLEENMFTNVESLELSDSSTLTTLFFQNNPIKYLRYHSFDFVPENVTIELDSTLVTDNKCIVGRQND